jgi:2-polyprenyl-3-methyl-5-hydroxy-6-metoxy-1,4-benzoquinol methylase
MLPQDTINAIFREKYRTATVSRDSIMNRFKYSGYALLDKIDPQEKVLDVGCGDNLFKSRLPNLIGIDPVTDAADHQVALLDYVTEEKFDVILCLGSVMYGELEDIKASIAHMSSMLNPGGRIYWRCITKSSAWWSFAWSRSLHETLSTEFGFTLVDIQDDYQSPNLPESLRIYAEWVKN